MIANLLQSHQERQHQAFTLNPFDPFKLSRQFLDRLLVERALFASELAERLDFGFFR